MAPWVLPVPALRVLCILLLLAAPLSTQHNSNDNPTCTDSLSVTSGECAIMSCNISNPLGAVSISLRALGKDPQFLFRDKPPGLFIEVGWQLWIEGGTAQLVIEEAESSHAGMYVWLLHGRQRTIQTTSLNVLEPPDLHPSLTETQKTPLTTVAHQNTTQNYLYFLLIPAVLVLAVIIWHKQFGPSKSKKCSQMWLLSAPGLRQDQECEQDQLESGIHSQESHPNPEGTSTPALTPCKSIQQLRTRAQGNHSPEGPELVQCHARDSYPRVHNHQCGPGKSLSNSTLL